MTTNNRTWIDIGSDVNWIDYGGRWAKHIGGTRYHVIRFENCEEWGDGATGYHCDLQEVNVTSDQLADALESCGWKELDSARLMPEMDLVKAECLSSYGAYAPLWSESGTNAYKLIRAAKRESRLLLSDAKAYQARMDRPVNAIGSTAREYQAGDMLSGVLRGVEAGDTKAELMLKMGVR